MLSNFIFSLNATVPVFLIIVLGYVLKRIGFIDDNFVRIANKINFVVALPALLIHDMMQSEFKKMMDGYFVLFCAVVTLVSILASWLFTKLLMKDKTLVGEFAQAAYRSSAALLGTAFVINMYGNSGLVPLMILGAVPLYNICAVIILTVECPDKSEDDRKTFGSTMKGILTNPIVIAIAVGIVLAFLDIKLPRMIDATLETVGKLSTPIALIGIGGAFEINKALKKWKPAAIATFMKLIGWGAIFIPIAIALGYTHEKLIAIIIMLCSPTTASCFIMAKSMKHEGTLTSSTIVLTTFFSAFTMTAVIFVCKTLGYL